MGSVLSSMYDRGRTQKKKKRRKQKYPSKRSLSSSSSSFSSPSKSRHTRHEKLRYQRDTSSSEPEIAVTKGNVRETTRYEKIEREAKKSHHRKKIPPSEVKNSGEGSSEHLSVGHFENYVRNKNQNKSEQNDRFVSVELDIPILTKNELRNQQRHPFVFNSENLRSSSTMNKTQFEDECIKAHNEYRACHSVGPLAKDKELTAKAQQWADKLAKRGVLEHSSNKGFGENVAFSSKSNPSGNEICKMWYDEIKDYNYRKPGFGGNTGHFTQVIWKDTTHVGVGVATGPKGTFTVANYKPAGNITNPGYFDRNVKKQSRIPKLPEMHHDKHDHHKHHRDNDRKVRRKSSSSSSDDDRKSTKPGTTVKTTKEEYVEGGVRKKKTITVTTTVTKTAEGTKTSTKTSTKIETIGDAVSDKLKHLDVHDSDSSSSDDDDDSFSKSEKRKFRRECLDRHNELRKKHGAPKLEKSRKLQRTAQKHANRMLRQGKLSHTSDGKYGENVAMKMPPPTGAEACDMWYGEIKDYDFRKSVFSGNTGHFTQVVWEASTHVGIGVACKDGRTYIAAFYDPPGNVQSQFVKNVKRRR